MRSMRMAMIAIMLATLASSVLSGTLRILRSYIVPERFPSDHV